MAVKPSKPLFMTRSELLNARRLPGRLDTAESAALLGFHNHDIPILTRAKWLKPLGNPAPNCVKYFSAVVIEALAKDEPWLTRATKLVNEHWHARNQNKKNGRGGDLDS